MEPRIASHISYIKGVLAELECQFLSHDGPLALEQQAAILAGGSARLHSRREQAKVAAIRIETAEMRKALAKRRISLKNNALSDEWLARLVGELFRCRMLLHPIV
jgi:hypothetical protein